jgi:hypothetical protein
VPPTLLARADEVIEQAYSRLLQRNLTTTARTALGHNPNTCSALACPVPPGADMVGQSGPLIKLAHLA